MIEQQCSIVLKVPTIMFGYFTFSRLKKFLFFFNKQIMLPSRLCFYSFHCCSHRNQKKEHTLTFRANYCEEFADESFVLFQSGQIIYLGLKTWTKRDKRNKQSQTSNIYLPHINYMDYYPSILNIL